MVKEISNNIEVKVDDVEASEVYESEQDDTKVGKIEQDRFGNVRSNQNRSSRSRSS